MAVVETEVGSAGVLWAMACTVAIAAKYMLHLHSGEILGAGATCVPTSIQCCICSVVRNTNLSAIIKQRLLQDGCITESPCPPIEIESALCLVTKTVCTMSICYLLAQMCCCCLRRHGGSLLCAFACCKSLTGNMAHQLHTWISTITKPCQVCKVRSMAFAYAVCRWTVYEVV